MYIILLYNCYHHRSNDSQPAHQTLSRSGIFDLLLVRMSGGHTALIGWPWARALAKYGLVPTAIGFSRDVCNILGIYLI